MTEGRRLTMLDERRAALETCGYCPKLCRGACPVSETEASEALIPWGKMSMTWYAARGDLAPDKDVAALPWACTGCFGCRDRCEHQNPVAETLRAARAEYRKLGLAPDGRKRRSKRSQVAKRYGSPRAPASLNAGARRRGVARRWAGTSGCEAARRETWSWLHGACSAP